jgi:hypothetical protein
MRPGSLDDRERCGALADSASALSTYQRDEPRARRAAA